MSANILTDEQIDELSREDLQNELRERDLSSGGSNVALRDRLKDWMREQNVPAVVPEGPAADVPAPDAPSADADVPPPAETPELPPVTPEVTPPAPTVDTVDTGTSGGRVTAYASNPAEEEPEAVELLEGDQPAESYRELCTTQTVVRVHDTHIVQVLNVPFGSAAKQIAFQQLGIRVRSFVNEELSAEAVPAEEPPIE